MKGALDRTKVVLRHLPPTISMAALLDQIDGSFAGRYNWVSFRPGKTGFSQKNLSYSRAYIDFKKPEDVVEFAEFFDGHIFVNEKGTQFKVIVEYAPSQRVPKQVSKKDGREGTIYKDSEYLEFLEVLAKPIENLPSAEIQLERKEAERSGSGTKDIPIVTPLMDFVRQRRAAKGSRRSVSNGKVSRRVGASSSGSPSSGSLRRGSGKKRVSTTMYVIRDPGKSATVKDKSTYVLVPKQGDQHLSDRITVTATGDGNQALEDESGVAGPNDSGKKKILLLKGKKRETITVSDSDSMSQMHNLASAKAASGLTTSKQNQRQEGSGRIIRRILSNKELRQSQSSRPHSEQQIPASILEKEKRAPRPSHVQLITKGSNGAPEDRISANDMHVSSERQGSHSRNKDRHDRGIWSSFSNGNDDFLPLSATSQVDSTKGSHTESKHDMSDAKRGDIKILGNARPSQSSENGFSKHLGRRGPTHGMKDADGYSNSSEGKHPRRSSASVYGSHEKQVWVQKASSGT
ncbi:regulator of nonsense transcripts UPF3-like isoform X2 [Prosopis cineraria]|uniref:regulator of nonsense transcripts UPF3-like isoform X2 n=1 Tax=Prosopis cineraria TaxID=364024 RepID=UPI002410885B|nr:regulator of nonsense transcripts UPF3-like isoform X2 [Prosopis cineraria]XP_054794581.1 regulator of nonsense transcripts UPF3-like isoform X2 [Prosopis cineraria]XP_054794582.1 regulator of nonsense transcripts UPF3-like isoform X2 [Prosopis cineraria]